MATPTPIDPAAFRDFELGGWDYAATAYAEHWLSLTSQAVPSLLDAARVGPSRRVLDVASGPGLVSQAAAERGTRVIGIDFSFNMVGLARATYPDLEFVSGDAEALPIRSASHESVVMNFGMLHLGQPERAVAEAFRVLRPGGSMAFTVWATPDQAQVFAIVLGAIQEYGNPNVALPTGPPFFRFSEPAAARGLLASAGFVDLQVVQLPLVWRIASAELLFDAMYYGTARTGGLLRKQAPGQVERIREAVVERLRAYGGEFGLSVPVPAMLTSGSRP